MAVITRLDFRFQRGGSFIARLLPDLAPKTVEAVVAMLPLEVTVYHTRWCGREINFPVHSLRPVPRERQTSTANTGDVVYWTEWEVGDGAIEALAVYYGAEVIRDHRGFLPVNVFARVPEDQWLQIEQIGLRIWQQGTERLLVVGLEEAEG